MNFDQEYWTNRYRQNETGWDIGHISTPLKMYFDQLANKNSSILIPGAGNAHEAEYLFNKGFSDITILDISEEPLKDIRKRLPGFDQSKILHGDFFEHDKKYDLIIEQTFFCAIDPKLRKDYAAKAHALLKNGGKLVGLLFNDVLNPDKPPFGGTKEEYVKYFSPYFTFHTFDPCYNSIEPRANRELFINLRRKSA